MRPKKQAKLQFNNTCDCIVDYDVLTDAMLWYSKGILRRFHKIYLHGYYPAVSIYKNKIHIHRLILLYINKDIDVNSLIVHHINHNKLDCRIDNLQLLQSNIHANYHNKGKRLSLEHRNKISERNRLNKGTRRDYKVIIPLNELKDMLLKGYSINKISKYFNCNWSTIKFRIHDNPELLNN